MAYQRKSHRRDAAIASAWALAGDTASTVPTVSVDTKIMLHTWPEGLEPSSGKLDEQRNMRKKEQIGSAAAHALSLIDRTGSQRVVEVGAGSGHLGLLLAYLRPTCHVTLVEIKEYSCEVARARISTLGLANASVAQGSMDEFARTGEQFDMIVGLHCCGLLTDAMLSMALERRAAACIIPCCYGQIAGSVDHDRGASTAPRMHPRSNAFRALPFADGAFDQLAKAADLAVAGDCSGPHYAAAKRCMLCVDADRLLWAQKEGCSPCNRAASTGPPEAQVPQAEEHLPLPPPQRRSEHSPSGTVAPTDSLPTDSSHALLPLHQLRGDATCIASRTDQHTVGDSMEAVCGVRIAIGELSPPTCSPKNNVLIMWWEPPPPMSEGSEHCGPLRTPAT